MYKIVHLNGVMYIAWRNLDHRNRPRLHVGARRMGTYDDSGFSVRSWKLKR